MSNLPSRLAILPASPGVYMMLDASGVLLYVGKAKNLKSRVKSYFVNPTRLAPKVAAMMTHVRDVQWLVVANVSEALMLENALIKRHMPRYNIKLKDAKQYPYIRLDTAAPWPRLSFAHRRGQDGAAYFGPYLSSGAVRESLDYLSQAFAIRTCKKEIPPQGGHARPCLQHELGRCPAPCAGRADTAAYRGQVEAVCDFLHNGGARQIRQLRHEMQQASAALQFERAAALRDRLRALEVLSQKQSMVLTAGERDVLALAISRDVVAVQVLHVRRGQVNGSDSHVMQRGLEQEPATAWPKRCRMRGVLVQGKTANAEKDESFCVDVCPGATHADADLAGAIGAGFAEAASAASGAGTLRPNAGAIGTGFAETGANGTEALLSGADKSSPGCGGLARAGRPVLLRSFKKALQRRKNPQLLESFILQYYADRPIPRELVVAFPLTETEALGLWLRERRGGAVDILCPKRGEKRAHAEMAQRNAHAALQRTLAEAEHQLARTHGAMAALQTILRLPTPPRRIEGFDISHTQGAQQVGSMVVFEDAKAARSQYRHFRIRRQGGADDFASMYEVVSRRLLRLLEDEGTPAQADAAQTSASAIPFSSTLSAQVGDSAPTISGASFTQPVGAALPEPDAAFAQVDGVAPPGPEAAFAQADGAVSPLPDVTFAQATSSAPPESSVAFAQDLNPEPLPESTVSEKSSGFGRRPDVLLIDGGAGQLAAVLRAMADTGVHLPVFALAKRLEEIYLPGQAPLMLPSNHPALHLIQRVRDESHRFAVTYHRSLRGKSALQNKLETIPNVGPATRRALLLAFGHEEALRHADVDALCAVKGVSRRAAEAIVQFYAAGSATE